jgi:hypothetical protein
MTSNILGAFEQGVPPLPDEPRGDESPAAWAFVGVSLALGALGLGLFAYVRRRPAPSDPWVN